MDDLEHEVAQAPQLQAIPLPDFELREEAQDVYWKHCQMLRDRGLLTDSSRELVMSLAIATNELRRCLEKNASTRYPAQERNAALGKLNKLYGNSAVSSSPEGANPYAAFGFAKRARQRRHHPD